MSNSHFDQIAGEYDESFPSHVVEHYLEKRSRFIQQHCPAGTALDVGCGTGLLAERLADAGYEVSGVDPSEGMLAVLRARRPEIRVQPASGADLPFADDTFDVVFSVAVMHHIAKAEAVRRTLAEMLRVAKPRGRVIVWDHNPLNPYWRLLMRRVPQDTGEERLIGQEELLSGLKGAGGHIVAATRLGMMPDFTPRSAVALAARAERLAERTPGLREFCASNVVMATKPRSP